MAWDADVRFPCLFRMLAPSVQSDDVNLFFTVVRHVADMKVFGHDGRIDVDGVFAGRADVASGESHGVERTGIPYLGIGQ